MPLTSERLLKKTYIFSDRTADHSVQDQINCWSSAIRLAFHRALRGEHLQHNLGSAVANVKARPPLQHTIINKDKRGFWIYFFFPLLLVQLFSPCNDM